MIKRLLPCLTVLAMLAAGPVAAVELGELTLSSRSGQPLQAVISLQDVQGLAAADVTVTVASAEDFERFSLERNPVLDNLQVTLDLSASGGPVARLATAVTVNEPFVALVLETRWPAGRLLTEYTLRLESPAFSAGVASQVISPSRSVNEEPVLEESLAEEPPAAEPATEPQVAAVPPATAAGAEQTDSQAEVSSPEPQSSPIVSNASTLTVNAGDTLWELALRARPDDSVSVQQTMLALQRLNPDAFIGGNINQVRRGAVLNVPEMAEIRRLGQTEAVQQVAAQNQAFAARAATPQPTAAAQGSATGGNAQGELRVVSVDEEQSEPADVDAAGSQDAEREQRLNELEDRLAVRQEELDRLDSENSELNARLDMLQQQIASAQEIIRLRDLELAQLQSSLAEQQREQAAAEPPPPTVVTLAPEAGPVQRLINSVVSNTWMLLGLAMGLVLLLVLVLVWRNRSARAAEQDNEHDADKLKLGDEDSDELLFAGVAAAAAEAEAEADVRRNDDLPDDQADDQTDNQAEDQPDNWADVQTDDQSVADDDDGVVYTPSAEAASLSEQSTSEQSTDSELSESDTAWTDSDPAADFALDDEFDLDSPAESQTEYADDTAAEQTYDFDADLEWPVEPEATEPEPQPEPEPEPEPQPEQEPEADDDDFDDLAFIPSEELTADDNLEDDDEDYPFLSDSDEAATKLDLARAYIDMGDEDGAREILAEVLEEGTETQRQDAQALLERL